MNKQIKDAMVSIIVFLFLIIGLTMAFLGWGTIDAGHRGVLLSMGAVDGRIYGEGLYGKIPFVHRIISMDVRIQKEQVETEGASKDLQTIKADIAVNFHINPEMVGAIYQQVGIDYMDRILAPALQESIKAVVSQYTAEELITKREIVREGIKSLLAKKMVEFWLVIDELNIVDFDFSPSFNISIEAKVTAEQNALTAKNKLAQVEFEAQQKVAEAKGKAEAISIESNALQNSPQILQLRAIEKWNGELPTVTGGAIPLIDLPILKSK